MPVERIHKTPVAKHHKTPSREAPQNTPATENHKPLVGKHRNTPVGGACKGEGFGRARGMEEAARVSPKKKAGAPHVHFSGAAASGAARPDAPSAGAASAAEAGGPGAAEGPAAEDSGGRSSSRRASAAKNELQTGAPPQYIGARGPPSGTAGRPKGLFTPRVFVSSFLEASLRARVHRLRRSLGHRLAMMMRLRA